MNKHSALYAVTIGAALVIAAPVFGQSASPSAEIAKEIRERVREEARDIRDDAREKVGVMREAAKAEVKKVREDVKEAREKAKDELEKKHEEMRGEIEKSREAAKKSIKANQDALKKQVVKIKDEKKRAVVEKLGSKFDELNKNRIDHFVGNVLEKLAAMMTRIEARIARVKTAGRDVVAVETSVVAAKKVIADANTAVTAQAAKVYKVTVIAEATAREDVKKIRDAYEADIRKTEDAVKAAREAVQNVARELAKVPGIGEFKDAASFAPTTPSTHTQ